MSYTFCIYYLDQLSSYERDNCLIYNILLLFALNNSFLIPIKAVQQSADIDTFRDREKKLKCTKNLLKKTF